MQRLTQHDLMVYSWQGDLYISFSWQYFIICRFSKFYARIVYSLVYRKKVYRKQLCKCYSGPVWRKSLHFVLSICLILVVWGPVQVFVFKSDVYQGTDPAGIIITSLSEMSCRARTHVSNGKRQRCSVFSQRVPERTFPYSWNMPRQSKPGWED